MDISSDKHAKSHTRGLRHDKEKETLKEQLPIAAQNNGILTIYEKQK